jgi:hypothetical protein
VTWRDRPRRSERSRRIARRALAEAQDPATSLDLAAELDCRRRFNKSAPHQFAPRYEAFSGNLIRHIAQPRSPYRPAKVTCEIWQESKR